MRIQEILSRIDSTEGLSEVIFRIRARGTPRTGGLIEEISSRPGVRHVRWDQA